MNFNIRRMSLTSIKPIKNANGEAIETKVFRILNNKEPVTDGAPIIYTDRKDGVIPDYDIRTDRWDVAVDAMDVVAKSKIAKRNYVQNSTDDVSLKKDMPTGQPIPGTITGDNPAA